LVKISREESKWQYLTSSDARRQMCLWTEVSRDFSCVNAGNKSLNQTGIKSSVKLLGLGDCPFMKGKMQRRKRCKLVKEKELKLPRRY